MIDIRDMDDRGRGGFNIVSWVLNIQLNHHYDRILKLFDVTRPQVDMFLVSPEPVLELRAVRKWKDDWT